MEPVLDIMAVAVLTPAIIKLASLLMKLFLPKKEIVLKNASGNTISIKTDEDGSVTIKFSSGEEVSIAENKLRTMNKKELEEIEKIVLNLGKK